MATASNASAALAPENLDQPIDDDVEIVGRGRIRTLRLAVDGTAVSWATLRVYHQQVGSRVIRMGGLAGVGTAEPFRGRGYGRRVVVNSLRWMRGAGMETGMLFGIADFYPKFGYAPAFPDIAHTLATNIALPPAAGGSLVAYRPRHLRAVLGMYRRNNAGRTGPVRRDAGHWQPFRKGVTWESPARAKLALDCAGKPVGYFAYDASLRPTTVLEAGWASPAAFPQLARAIVQLARRQGSDRVDLRLPEDDAFVVYCRAFGLRTTIAYRTDGEAMVRMINVAGTLATLAPSLAERLGGRGALNIRTNLDGVGLSWGGGECVVGDWIPTAAVAALPQWALAQLVYGYAQATALRAGGVLRASAAAAERLEAMFPPTRHFYHCIDEF